MGGGYGYSSTRDIALVVSSTVTFRAFSRRFYLKRLTKTFVIRSATIHRYRCSKDDVEPTYSLYTAVILTTVDATQMTILLKLYKIQHTLGAYIKCQDV